jgi:hypothetical protein
LATGSIVLSLLLLAAGLICDAMAEALVEAKHLT